MTAAKATRKPRTRKTQAVVPKGPFVGFGAVNMLIELARAAATEPPVFWERGEVYHRSDGGTARLCRDLERERREREDAGYQRALDDGRGPLPTDPEPWEWYREDAAKREAARESHPSAPLPVGDWALTITFPAGATPDEKVEAIMARLDDAWAEENGAPTDVPGPVKGDTPPGTEDPPTGATGPGTQTDDPALD